MQDEITYKLLKAIEKNPEMSQRELSRELGVSLGKTNYCIKALIKKGLIKASNFRNSRNKSRYLYLLTPKGVAMKAKVTLRFLKLKISEYEMLTKEIEILKDEAAI